MPTVRVQAANGDVTMHELEGDAITMGRSELCVLRIHDLSLSRIHAVLRLEDGQWLVSDAGSRAGTKLNGERIKGAHRLEAGDEIQLAECILTFEPAAMAMATPIPPTKSMAGAEARPVARDLPPANKPLDALGGSTGVHHLSATGGAAFSMPNALSREGSENPTAPPIAPASPSIPPSTEELKGATRVPGSTAGPAVESTRAFAMPVLGAPVGEEQERGDRGSTNPALVGRSPEAVTLRGLVSEYADTLKATLVVGADGTEKEHVARALHGRSPRADQTFVTARCAGLKPGAPELFGNEMDHAHSEPASEGSIAEAHGGTLFLDEVAELAADAQVSLLEFLQTGQIRGGAGAIPRAASVRIIASTKHDLKDLVEAGFFSAELEKLLAAQTISVPSLARRPQDIPDLVGHFLALPSSRVVGISRDALDALSGCHYDENVRELRYALERARNSCSSGTIEVSDLPAAYQPAGFAQPEAEALLREIAEKRASFWEVVQAPLVAGELSKGVARAVIALAHHAGGDSYKGAATRLGVSSEFQRFLNFVNRNGLGI